MSEYGLKHFAHLGDAIWETFIRLHVISLANTQKKLHELTTDFVNANFQASVLDFIKQYLNENELELIKRGRNMPLTAQKKNNQNIHRQANAFEILVGYLYLNNKERLFELFEIIKQNKL